MVDSLMLRSRLFWKYVIVLVFLVSGALVTSGAVEIYFSYQENKTALVSVQWVLFGYSLAFGPDVKGLIGGLDWAGLSGVGIVPNADYAATVPHIAFMAYQMMFAVITPALMAAGVKGILAVGTDVFHIFAKAIMGTRTPW
jgi:ammonia channel protein AmtB